MFLFVSGCMACQYMPFSIAVWTFVAHHECVKAQLRRRIVCRFDKVFGMFITQDGKIRRMDLIITPHEEYPFCLLGWTGSKQYLRFLRQHAGNCNMYLNSHRQELDRMIQHACPLHLLQVATGCALTRTLVCSELAVCRELQQLLQLPADDIWWHHSCIREDVQCKLRSAVIKPVHFWLYDRHTFESFRFLDYLCCAAKLSRQDPAYTAISWCCLWDNTTFRDMPH